MQGNKVAVLKGGRIADIAEDDLQAGDLILLQTGDVIAADLKLLEATNLEVDEFDVTGGMMPVLKSVSLGESDVVVYQGSRVLRGQGKGIVISVKENTEYGKILKQSSQYRKDEKICLIKKRHLRLLWILLPTFLISLRQHEGHHLLIIMAYGALAVLLLLVQNSEFFKFTLMRREQNKLVKNNIIVNDCKALDEIREIDIFCFDKTGVLTSRNIKVKEIDLGGEQSADGRIGDHAVKNLIITACVLCNDLTYFEMLAHSSPIDQALVSFAVDNGAELEKIRRQYQRIYEKPFNSEERYMACGFKNCYSEQSIYLAKGDPDVLLKKCSRYMTSTGVTRSLDFDFLLATRSRIDVMNRDGGIVIALACAEGSSPPSTYTYLCLFQLVNPLKPETARILSSLKEKGIRSIMLTGDRTATSLSIATQAGIENASILYLTGTDIAKMSLAEVARQSNYISVFTGLLPSQKGIIVRLLQQRGHRVAMVGDGANDVIALKAADVAISFVELSSSLAKRAAKILINNLSDILHLVEAARKIRRQAGYITALLVMIFLAVLVGSLL